MPFSFRIPDWCTQPLLWINGKKYPGELKTGSFVTVQLSFTGKAIIKLSFAYEASGY